MPKLPIRIAVVCFSMLLVGGYVYLRAGGDPKVMSGSKSASGTIAAPTSQATISFTMPGSKGGVVVLAPSSTQPTVMSSSKSAAVIRPQDLDPQSHVIIATTAPTADLRLRPNDPRTTLPSQNLSIGPPTTLPVFFPGSKSDTLISGGSLINVGSITVSGRNDTTAPATTRAVVTPPSIIQIPAVMSRPRSGNVVQPNAIHPDDLRAILGTTQPAAPDSQPQKQEPKK
jgi:hypothetical protein